MDPKKKFDRIRPLAKEIRIFFDCDVVCKHEAVHQRCSSCGPGRLRGSVREDEEAAAGPAEEHPREIWTGAGAEARSQPKKSRNLFATGRMRSNSFLEVT